GRVVGINTAIATTGDSGSIGVGFAIPSNAAAEVAEELITTGAAEHPLLGVSVEETGTDPDAPLGARVVEVVPGGPADRGGLRVGDVVTGLGERTVTDADSLIVAVRSHDPGDTVTVTYVRDGRTGTTEATLTTATPPPTAEPAGHVELQGQGAGGGRASRAPWDPAPSVP